MKALKWPEPALSDRARRVLAVCAALAIAPQVFFIPAWLVIPCLLLTLACAYSPPPVLNKKWRFVLYAVLIASQVMIGLYFRRIWGREPGISLLTVMVAAKLLEVRSTRDAMVVWCSSAVLLVALTTFHQELITLVYLLCVLLALFALLDVIHDAHDTHRLSSHVRQAIKRLLIGVPIALVLFVFFPRLAAPLWGFSEQKLGRTGLSDSLRMGQISELIKSDEVAFRVEFKGGLPPPRNMLYWRGPVLDRYNVGPDGVESWDGTARGAAGFVSLPDAPTPQELVSYAVTMNAHNERWIFALDVPATYPKGGILETRTRITTAQQLITSRPVREAVRYEIQSLLRSRYPADMLDARQSVYTGSKESNPRARAWAKEQLERAGGDQREYLSAVVKHIREKNFRYTTRPPLLSVNAVDAFWFDTQLGFCEHYSSAFVFLMRAAGIPARIVTGYQGGEMNSQNDVLVVRQSDAHAWAEVVIGDDWVRVDPTAAIAPNRIEQSLNAAIPESERSAFVNWQEHSFLTFMRQSWDATQHAYAGWLLGYDRAQQERALSRFGFENVQSLQAIGYMLLFGVAAVLSTIGLYALRERMLSRKRADHAERLWLTFLKRARRAGLGLPLHTTPRDALQHVRQKAPHAANAAEEVLGAIERTRYGPEQLTGSQARSLRRRLQRLALKPVAK